MKKLMILAICMLSLAMTQAHSLPTELFGKRYADAMTQIQAMLGKPTMVKEDKVEYSNVEYEGFTWDEAYFHFTKGILDEARFYSHQQGKAGALRHVSEVAKALRKEHAMSQDYEDRHTFFYKGGRSPMEFGHLFTIFVSPYKGGWTTQLRYGPFQL